jgi:KaiC/GvpD/RAD55 family RecA-like ATPase
MSQRAASPEDLAALAAEINAEARPKIRLLTVDDLADLPEPTWLVDGWVPEHGFTVLYGASGSFKSFLALAWSLHVASGTPWYDHPVEQGDVVYLSLEGGYGLRKRIEAWQQELPDADVSAFRSVVVPLSLLDDATVEELAAAIQDAVGSPKLLVIDTASRAMQGGNENAPEVMGAFIAAADRFIHSWDTAVVAVHHSGHGEHGRERGHSSLPAAADCRISTKRDATRAQVTVTQEKAKDAEEREPVVLARRVVSLPGLDSQGNPRSSIVLDWSGYKPSAKARADTREADCQQAILDVLANAEKPMAEDAVQKSLNVPLASDRKKEILAALVAEGKVHRTMRGNAKMHTIATDAIPGLEPDAA